MNYDPIEVVASKLVKTFNLQDWEYDIEDIVEDVAEALKHIGAAKVFLTKVADMKVSGLMARLPRDHEHTKEVIPGNLKYFENGPFFQVDKPDGFTFQLVYQAMPTDPRGYVLIPDSAAVREALMWYLVKILIFRGVVKTVSLGFADQEWHWRCSSARADLNVFSPKAAYEIYKSLTSLAPTNHE